MNELSIEECIKYIFNFTFDHHNGFKIYEDEGGDQYYFCRICKRDYPIMNYENGNSTIKMEHKSNCQIFQVLSKLKKEFNI